MNQSGHKPTGMLKLFVLACTSEMPFAGLSITLLNIFLQKALICGQRLAYNSPSHVAQDAKGKPSGTIFIFAAFSCHLGRGQSKEHKIQIKKKTSFKTTTTFFDALKFP
jgi:hypothetical protein